MVQPMQPPIPTKKRVPTWIVVLLILGGLAILVVPVMGALAIYGVRKYIANAKTAEARNSLGQIGKDAATAFLVESLAPVTGRHRGSALGATHGLCRSASAPIPASLLSIRGVKYQSTPAEWDVDRVAHAGFACLKFELAMPQYYQYGYTAHGSSAPGDGFAAVAHGDLNGDGVTSEFSLAGAVDSSDNLLVAPNLKETNPDE